MILMLYLTVSRDDHDRRLDRVLRKAFPGVPPGALAGAVRRGAVRVNGRRCRNETRLSEGDTLKVPVWDDTEGASGTSPEGTAELDADRLIHRGRWRVPVIERSLDRLVLNKPAGLATHGPDSLEQIVRSLAAREGWWAESLSFRPGPVHRLDRNTSGIQLFALTAEGARTLSTHFAQGDVFKLYLAVLEGVLTEERQIALPMTYDNRTRRAGAGQATALTRVIPLATAERGSFTLAAAIPQSGRTHQIRYHCSAIGHPLEHDRKYGAPDRADASDRAGALGGTRYFLHSLLLALPGADAAWVAPLEEWTRRRLEHRFPDLPTISRRLEQLVHTTCTVNPGTDTIRI